MFQIPFFGAKSHSSLTKRGRRGLPQNDGTRRLRHEPLEERQLLAVYANTMDMPIDDPGTIWSEISVSDAGVIQDLDVQLTIEHKRAEDLDVHLIAPDGTRVELFTDVGGRADNFISTTLDDEAATSIAAASAPFTGTFRPEGDLSVVEGTGLTGTWTLEVTDDKSRESGVLKNWAISVEIAGIPEGDFIDSNPAMLGNVGGEYNGGKDLVVADNGDAMAVWQESEGAGDSGPWRAMAAEYDAATDTWDTPVVISELTTPYDVRYSLCLAGDGRGNYVAAWRQSSNTEGDVWVNRYIDGSGWQTPEIIGAGTLEHPAHDPTIAMAYDSSTGETKAVFAWGYDGNVLISRLTDFSEGVWSSPDIAADVADILRGPECGVEMAADGDVLMLFETYDTADLYYRHYDWDADWTTGSVSLLEMRSEVTVLADLAMNSSGVAVATWSQRTGANDNFEIWARHWNGTDWSSTPELVVDSQDGHSAIFPIVSIAENDEAIVFWRQQRDGAAFRDAYVRHFDGEQWATSGGLPEIIKVDAEDLGDVGAGPLPSEIFNWSMAMDDAGNAIASWTQDDGTDINLWAARFDRASSTWATAEKIEDAPLDALQPVVAMNGTGDNQIIWTQSDGAQNHIYAATIPEPGNLPPTANPDSASTLEDVAVTIDIVTLLANDTDPDLDPISITGFGTPGNGTLVENGDETVTYTPAPDFNGTDTFTYTISDGNGGTDTATVTVNVTAVNDAPVAVDDVDVTQPDTPLTVAAAGVLANDTDVDGDDLTAVLGATVPTNGSVGLNSDGSFTYTPNAGFFGTDSFSYVTNDGTIDSNVATVTITVEEATSEYTDTSTGDPLNIGDNKTVSSPIVVSGTGAIVETLTVQINLTHANPGDLTAQLIPPVGDPLPISLVLPLDYAHEYVISGVAGLDLDGTWTLQVTDQARDKKKGTLFEWTMTAELAPVESASSAMAADVALLALSEADSSDDNDPSILTQTTADDLALMMME